MTEDAIRRRQERKAQLWTAVSSFLSAAWAIFDSPQRTGALGIAVIVVIALTLAYPLYRLTLRWERWKAGPTAEC